MPAPSPHHRSIRRRTVVTAGLAVSLTFAATAAACAPSGGGSSTTTTTRVPTTTSSAPATTTTTAVTTTTAGGTSGPSVDLTHLPLGDGKYGSTAQRGYIKTCQTTMNGGGASAKGPWFNSDGTTWDATKKGVVDGDVSWPNQLSTSVSGGVRTFTGNDLPNHTTGKFPIASTDDVYAYDRNPNSIAAQTLSVKMPAAPTVAATPSCIRGEVGLALTGVEIFDGLDAGGRDAVAWEAQDHCQGHPQDRSAYHYHSLTTCIADPGTGQSALLGYALDGFGIYGPRGADGKELTDADLDECHGTTSPVMWDGQLVTMYHYVATREFPYTVGGFTGTPMQTQI